MGRTACTEPQCLYKGALYLTVELYLYSPYGPYGLYRASVPVQGWPLLFTCDCVEVCKRRTRSCKHCIHTLCNIKLTVLSFNYTEFCSTSNLFLNWKEIQYMQNSLWFYFLILCFYGNEQISVQHSNNVMEILTFPRRMNCFQTRHLGTRAGCKPHHKIHLFSKSYTITLYLLWCYIIWHVIYYEKLSEITAPFSMIRQIRYMIWYMMWCNIWYDII
jgi:hypothetical protein